VSLSRRWRMVPFGMFGYTQDSSGNSITPLPIPTDPIRKETFNPDGYLINMVSAVGAPSSRRRHCPAMGRIYAFVY